MDNGLIISHMDKVNFIGLMKKLKISYLKIGIIRKFIKNIIRILF
jgi:hypothetical protein